MAIITVYTYECSVALQKILNLQTIQKNDPPVNVDLVTLVSVLL